MDLMLDSKCCNCFLTGLGVPIPNAFIFIAKRVPVFDMTAFLNLFWISSWTFLLIWRTCVVSLRFTALHAVASSYRVFLRYTSTLFERFQRTSWQFLLISRTCVVLLFHCFNSFTRGCVTLPRCFTMYIHTLRALSTHVIFSTFTRTCIVLLFNALRAVA